MLTLIAAVLLSATPKVVSPEWNAVNVKKEAASFYADLLADELRKQGLQVITSQDIATLLGMERQKALVGCADEAASCMAELANALGADATLTVNVMKLDDGAFRGVAKLISSSSGNTLSSVQLDASTEKKLLASLARVAKELARPVVSGPIAPVAEARAPAAEMKPGVKEFWWLFGLAGLVVGGGGGGLLGGAHANWAALQTTADYETANDLASKGKFMQSAGYFGIAVGGGLLVTSVLLLLWPSATVVPQATVSPAGATLGLGGVF